MGAGKRPSESLSPAVELVEMLQTKAKGFAALRHWYSLWENKAFFHWEVECQVFKAGGLKPGVHRLSDLITY